MKILKIVIYFFIVTSILSCGKYEDGPIFSLRTVKKRLEGTWQATKQIENGNSFINNHTVTFSLSKYSNKAEGNVNTYTLYTSNNTNNEEKWYGNWELSEDKKQIYLSFNVIEYDYGEG